MSRSSGEVLAKYLAELPKHQNLVVTFLLANSLSLGIGLLVGQMWADGSLPRPLTPSYQKYQIKDRTSLAPKTDSVPSAPLLSAEPTARLININKASASDLDSLPGIGLVYSQKIISGRPYTAVTELLTRKIIPLSTYNKIKGQISAQ
ncbi:MAG TPA: helix-hairpin-helix domain-containing protein [Patescibacteria group bacterium]|nr:helix-hairpin-helix domain-containing protein [Patescibacteria group bacterium]